MSYLGAGTEQTLSMKKTSVSLIKVSVVGIQDVVNLSLR
jgi:hypothetical protein